MANILAEVEAHFSRLELSAYSDAAIPLQATGFGIAYSNIGQFNFADDRLYGPLTNNIPSYLMKETQIVAQLADNIEIGKKILSILYCYRGVARALPQAQNQEQSNRNDLYKAAFEILKPEIKKIKDVHKFSESFTSLVPLAFQILIPEYEREGFASPNLLQILGESLSLILTIDILKNGKASMNNDFSMYKRILSNLKNLVGEVEDETLENHALYSFLGTQNIFALKLKEKLSQVIGWEDIMVDVVNYCATQYENKLYVTPESKYSLLKAIAFGLQLLDQEGEERDVAKRKKLRLDRFARILKAKPVIPLLGDVILKFSTMFTKSPRMKELRLEHDPSDEIPRSYSLPYHMQNLRSIYVECSRSLFISLRQSCDTDAYDHSKAQAIYVCVLKTLQCLADITSRVVEQSAWKFSNPTSSSNDKTCPTDATSYELAVRYNYSTEDRASTSECIGMIKNLEDQLLNISRSAFDQIITYMHGSLQNFARTTLRDMIIHTRKKKKQSINIVLHILSIACDRFDSLEFDEKRVKDSPNSQSYRRCPIAFTQFHYIRILLDSITSDRAKGMQGGFLKDKDFKDQHITETEEFLSISAFFKLMVDYNTTVKQCADLSELWFKEFYLELSKQIQFPIEMSLPFILTNEMLDSDDPSMTELVLYPFDIYNDAANRALHILHCRFLYDEIEAEVNLCFDQLMYKLSQKIFADFKSRASSIILDKSFRKELETLMNINAADSRFDFENLPYSTLLSQDRYQLLGRTVCIGKIIAQFCNQHMRQSLDVAIGRYEMGDLTSIVELESLIECSRLTHKLLSEYVLLDNFDDILNESNEQVSLIAYNGRIVTHTVQQLLNDFLPQYGYNSTSKRFIRRVGEEKAKPQQKVSPMYLYGCRNLCLAYNAVNQLYRSFFGQEHIKSLIRMLGKDNIHIILGELVKSVELTLKFILTPYVRALTKGLPHSTKLPPFEYGLIGCFDYFQVILKPLLSYSDLRSGVFQAFQEVGNSIVFLQLLEGSLCQNVVTEGLLVDMMLEHSQDGSCMKSVIQSAGQKLYSQSDVFENSDNLICSLEGRSKQTDLLISFTNVVSACIRDLQWDDSFLHQDDLAVDHCTEFYRIWSVILFAFILSTSAPTSVTSREMFGDGFLWSGALFIYLLNQSKRFKTFDFVNYLIQVSVLDNRFTAANQSDNSSNLNAFIEFAKYVMQLTTEAMDSFESLVD